MPQLDKVTFLSQFFWLCIFYLGLYLVLYKYFLPKLSRILAVRKRKMGLSPQGLSDLQHEHSEIRTHVNTMFSKALGTSRHMVQSMFAHTTSWVDTRVNTVHATHYRGVHDSYLHTLGETSLSHHLGMYHAGHHQPDQLALTLIVEKLKTSARGELPRETMGDAKKSKKLK